MKKVISVFISAVMLFCVTVGSVFPAFAGQPIFGYDVSHNNELVNFTDAKNDGKNFVMIRLGYYNHLDKNFWANVENACKANMDFGVYLYSYAYNAKEAQIEADFVLDTISQMGDYEEYFTLPVAYDLEYDKIPQNCTKSMINNQMTVFCDTIKKAGYTPMVYVNNNWFTNYIDASVIKSKGYKFWYAYWKSNPDFSSPIKAGNTNLIVDMWQYLGGIDGVIDENIIYNPDDIVKERGCVHKIKTTVTKATASNDGKVVKSCSKCNQIISSSLIPKASSVKLSAASYTYDGKTKTPSVTVKDSKGKTLKKSTDYTVSYASGRKNVGKYSAKITFKGNYSGTKTLYFTINPKATTLSSLSAKSKGFTSKWKKQSIQVTGYQIQYSTSSKFTSPKTSTISSYKTTSKTISKLKGKKKYYVRVRTYKTVGKTKYYSSWSKAKSVTTKK